MSEERIELVFNVQGAETVAKAEAAIEKTGRAAKKATTEIYDFADVYEVIGAEAPQVKRALDAVDFAMEDLARDADKASAALLKVGKTATGTREKAINYGQGLQSVAFTAQDFMSAQGDISRGLFAIQNNLPGLITQFGGTAGLAGAVGIAGLAIGALIPVVTELWKQFSETRNPLPRTKKTVEDLRNELSNAKETTKELGSQTTLTTTEMAKYNAARETTARLEKEIADQEERQAIIKGATGPSAEQKKRGTEFAEAVGGKAPEIMKALAEAERQASEQQINKDRDRMNAEVKKRLAAGEDPDAVAKFAQEELKRHEEYARTLRTGLDQLAEDLFVRAMKGDESAQKQVLGAAAANVTGSKAMRNLQKLADKRLTDTLEAEGARIEKMAMAEVEAMKEADRKLTDALEKQGAEIGAAAEPEAEKALKDRDSQKKVAQTATVAANRAAFARETAGIKAGGYQEAAASLMAQTKAQGGVMDAYGRFHKLTDDQIFEYVQNEVAKHLHREVEPDVFGRRRFANPQMGREETGDVATRITSMAQTAMQQSLGANQGDLIGVVQELSAEHDRFLMEQARQAGEIRGLRSNGRKRAQTAMNTAG